MRITSEDFSDTRKIFQQIIQNKSFILTILLIFVSFLSFFLPFHFVRNKTNQKPDLDIEEPTTELKILQKMQLLYKKQQEVWETRNFILQLENPIEELKQVLQSKGSSKSKAIEQYLFYFDFLIDLLNYTDPYSSHSNEDIRFIVYPNYNQTPTITTKIISENQIRYEVLYEIFDEKNQKILFNSSEITIGNINYFRNLTFDKFPICSTDNFDINDSKLPNSNNTKTMSNVIIIKKENYEDNEYWIYHFLGTLLQIRPFIKDKGWTLLIDSNTHEIPYQLLNLIKEDFNVKLEVYDPSITYKIDKLMIICNSPFIHPRKFQEIRAFLVKNILKINSNEEIPIYKQENIIYLPRVNNHNERNVINNEEIENYLRKRFGNKLKIFSHKEHQDLKELVEYFSKAKIIIGAHGGAFYNLLFSLSHPIVIEFQGKPFFGELSIFYWISHTTGNEYWIDYTEESGNDLIINLDHLEEILNNVLKEN
ncbi:hypothetical protein M0811_07117 [Anaeramoeba ignava]|uniref:Glycosyltransferase 61 catalytic domain-containing protein n=1 Tax=Anaeramoeba ignava TaxID=1746090 RepID=A0A9Q0LMI3_ANAIG|nr:hypothetical protein M0811_07117 [Anaeramoeba ignava]